MIAQSLRKGFAQSVVSKAILTSIADHSFASDVARATRKCKDAKKTVREGNLLPRKLTNK
jgi:hypothetical protein